MRNRNGIARWTLRALIVGAAVATAAATFAQPPGGRPGRGGDPGFTQGRGGPGGNQQGPGQDQSGRQRRQRPGGIERMLQRMDQDGDGMVTKEEYMAGSEEAFARMDTNQDGVLDKTDAPQRGQQGRGADPAAIQKKMDTDGDGKIAAAEWKGPERAFQHIDADQDGFVTVEELTTAMANRPQRGGPQGSGGPEGQQGPPPQGQPGDLGQPDQGVAPDAQNAQNDQRRNRGAAMIDRLFQADADQDGKISAEEYQGPKERFTRLDADKDGYVTREEAAQMTQRFNQRRGGQQGQGNPQDFLARFDKDQDGKLTAEELPRERLFKMLDANGDGVVDQDEAAKLAQMRQRRGGQGGQRQAH